MPPEVVTVTTPELPANGEVTFNEVADALVTIAATALKFTLLLEATASKSVPVIVTETPATPDVGLIEVIAGAVPDAGFLQPEKTIAVKTNKLKRKVFICRTLHTKIPIVSGLKC